MFLVSVNALSQQIQQAIASIYSEREGKAIAQAYLNMKCGVNTLDILLEKAVEEPVNFQQEFSEPEEMVRPTRSNANTNFAAPAPSFEGEPTFGDPKILSNLEKLSSQGPKSKRGRPPKTK